MSGWRLLGLALLAMSGIAVIAAVVLIVVARSDHAPDPAATAAEQLERSGPVWRGIGDYGGQRRNEPPPHGE